MVKLFMMREFNLIESNFSVFLLYIYMNCILIITQFENPIKANDVVVSQADYPLIYSLKYDCEKQENSNDLPATCSSKAWLVADNMKLGNDPLTITETQTAMANNMSSFDNCKKICLTTASCIAFVRHRNEPKQCWFYDQSNKEIKNDNYKTYLLKCCKLKKNETSDKYLPNFPILFQADACEPQTDNFLKDARTCYTYNYLWQHVEEKQLSIVPFKNETLESIANCMYRCQDNHKCFAAGTQVVNEFDQFCLFYDAIDQKTQNCQASNVFELVCCQLKEDVLNRTQNLVMSYKPHQICKNISSTNVKTCAAKIWHIEDGVKISGKTLGSDKMWSFEFCLNKCAENAQCVAVSFDLKKARCWFLDGGDYTRVFRQHQWILYSLKCCHGFIDKNFYRNNTKSSKKEPQITRNVSIFDSVDFPSYPVISDINEECLPEVENVQVDKCSNKAWLIVHNLKVKKTTTNNVATGTNVLHCFEDCMKSPHCTGITIKKSKKESCWIHNGNHQLVNETDKEYISFFLTCCQLKKPQSYRGCKEEKIIFSNFPILFDPKSSCKDTNVFAVPCSYPTWHVQEGIDLEFTLKSGGVIQASGSSNGLPNEIIRNLTNPNVLDKLNECANNILCRIVTVEMVSPFVTNFDLYEIFLNEEQKIKTNTTKIVFQKFCCKFPSEKEMKSKSYVLDLVVFSQPLLYCKNISNADVDCPVKVWFMRDGVRLKGHFLTINQLNSVQSCLHDCLQNSACNGVSIDYYQRRCLLFGSSGFKEYENQPQWVTFLRKCCNGIGKQCRY